MNNLYFRVWSSSDSVNNIVDCRHDNTVSFIYTDLPSLVITSGNDLSFFGDYKAIPNPLPGILLSYP